MNQTYHIFGLNIQSDIMLPALPISESGLLSNPDVVIEYGDTPTCLTNDQNKGTYYQVAPGKLLLNIDSVARYYVQKGSHIIITPAPGASEEKILVFLMGSAVGALLHQRNILVLHAGAIVANDQGIVFSGQSGVGKSTLAAGFHKRGYPFLADDVCAIAILDGKPAAIPGFPRLKLWGDALNHFSTDQAQLKSIRWTRGLEKYFLPVEQLHKTPVFLKTIFTLEIGHDNVSSIKAIKGAEKINTLIENTYRFSFLHGLGGKKDHFRQCAAVASHTNMHRVIRSNAGFCLDELLDLLQDKFD